MCDERPTHLDLFSGIGGFALAAYWAGFRTRVFVEIDKYCQKVLSEDFGIYPHANGSNGSPKLGQQQKELAPESDRIRIHSDIFDFDGTAYRGCDLLTGGFPCQPFSVAGKRRGAADDRHLWPEMLRVIKEARPDWVLGENVPGIIPMELDNVLSDLESIGYATRPFVIPACAVDARHRRDRLWIICRDVSDSNEQRSQGWNGEELRECASERIARASDSSVCDSAEQRLSIRAVIPMGATGGLQPQPQRPSGDCCWWQPEPDVGRVAHGIPSRVDRLKGLGNAIVPQVAFEILREIRRMI